MTNEEILQAIREVIVEKLEVPAEKVQMESNFKEDLGADSLDIYELIYAIEEKLKIMIPDDQSPELNTVGDAVKFIAGLESK